MGLTAFAVFIIPWVVLALFLTRAPTVLRLGAAPAPWRPLTHGRDRQPSQPRQTNRYNAGTSDGTGPTGGDKHEPIDIPGDGALGSSVEPTEPGDKV